MALMLSHQTKKLKMGFKYAVSGSSDQVSLAEGLKELYKNKVLCDAELVSSSDRFPCHKAVLAAKSRQFADVFAKDEPSATRTEVRVYDASPEAVKLLLDYMYEIDDESYDPKSPQVNLEVLQLADNFGLPHLKETCAAYMAKELNTDNVIDTISAAHKYSLVKLRERILVQLTGNKKALQDLAQAPQIIQHPDLMRELLGLLAQDGQKDSPKTTPNKKARKA